MHVEGNSTQSFEPKISIENLKRMYEAMVLTRLFDIKSLNLQRQGRIGFYVPCLGQEAAQVGSAVVMRSDDWLLPTYRDVGVAFIRGITVRRMFAHLMGNSEDAMLGRQMPSHWGFKDTNYVSVASTIAAHLPVAVGVAMGIKIRKEDKVVLAYHGDGATSEGDFHVALNFAGVYKAPTVFICENNGWAISVPVSKQTASQSLAQKAAAYGFDGVRVDGNDVLAVYKATLDAVENARRGGGPTLIECLTYRMGPHSTSDDPTKYRTKEEMELWKKRDPIQRFKTFLETKGFWNEGSERSLQSRIENELNLAIKEEEKVPVVPVESIFGDVYKEQPWFLKEEQESEERIS